MPYCIIDDEAHCTSAPCRSKTSYRRFSAVVSGYRYYHPEEGRWLGRDRIEENGGENLFGYCYNDGINETDALGLLKFKATDFSNAEGKIADFTGIADDKYGYSWAGKYQSETTILPLPIVKKKKRLWNMVVVADVEFTAGGTIAKKKNGKWVLEMVSERTKWTEWISMEARAGGISKLDIHGFIPDKSVGDFVICDAIVWETISYGPLDIKATGDSIVNSILNDKHVMGFQSGMKSNGKYLLSSEPLGWKESPKVRKLVSSKPNKTVDIIYAYKRDTRKDSVANCPCGTTGEKGMDIVDSASGL